MKKYISVLIGVVVTVLVVAAILFRAQIATLFAAPPPCGQDTLTLNETTYLIQTVNEPPPAAPKTLPAALMLAGSDPAPVIWLYDSHTLDLPSTGLPAVITWANCNTATYLLQDPQPQPPTPTDLTLIVNGVTLHASLQTAEISAIPSPNPSDLLLEVSLLETQIDAETITFTIKIVNYGKNTVSATAQTITLGGVSPQISQPILPQEIDPGASANLTVTFARPTTLPAELKVFDAVYEVGE